MAPLRNDTLRRACATAFLVLCWATTVHGQRLAPPILGDSPTPHRLNHLGRGPLASAPLRGTGSKILGGLVEGTAGFFAGAIIGGALGGGNRICGDDPCGLEEALWGAAAGVSIGIPVGVHVANRGRGSLLTGIGASLAVGAGGLVAAHSADNGLPLLLIPAAQLAVSLSLER